MKKISLTLIIALFVISCADKNAVHEPVKNELLAYTQKFEIVRTGNDRYLAIGTYLNPVLKKNTNEEIFILSSYPKEEPINLKTIRVNGDSNLSIKKLDYNDELLKLVNINLPWSYHYKIIAPVKNSNYLTIAYDTNRSLRAVLKFQKVSKSMYWNPEIKLDNR
ncbi:hypothetical protein [Campylobacter blaseri]|uniref:Lipoprotein n=1 Tax=Campylobacter blaseri TaxID=2042961 RepID=A0A2P8QZZ3_9BACT|nr:hypothetical protein [Campylobacter blaseri]PSM51813.1 hypothetical protein CQ405_06710 [Campylobacter blaseri]PSM53604.1 hypothetical protein CRN67_06715 [Campylobacter blaseri]